MKILIIEDEEPAALRLKKLVEEILPEAQILDMLVSVRSTVEWFKSHTAPDLIFMDINLADGSSFEIFSKTKIDSPVIFITAYDEYAMKAFKVNSIDYLLKPVKKEELVNAIEKFKKIRQIKIDMPDLKELFENINWNYVVLPCLLHLGMNIILI